jgi:hypothetical protein
MAVDQARDDGTAVEIGDLGIFARKGLDLIIAADSDDRVTGHSDRFGNTEIGIDRNDFAVQEYLFCRRLIVRL